MMKFEISTAATHPGVTGDACATVDIPQLAGITLIGTLGTVLTSGTPSILHPARAVINFHSSYPGQSLSATA